MPPRSPWIVLKEGTAWADPVYNAAGNMTTMPRPSPYYGSAPVTYDAWNRMAEVQRVGTTTRVWFKCRYDGPGRRILAGTASIANPPIDHFFYNASWQVLETRDGNPAQNAQPEYQYVWSPRYIDAPVLRDKNTDTDGLCDDQQRYYLGDANFNVTTLIDTTGTAVNRYLFSSQDHATFRAARGQRGLTGWR